MGTSTEFALRARWALSPGQSPLEHGFVVVRGGHIVSVGTRVDASLPVIDLRDAIILPGLVNAHTHLEFSDCATPLGAPDDDFAAWIGRVTRYRMLRAEANPTAAAAAIEQGILESTAAGTTAIGEIATALWQFPAAPPPIDLICFREAIALAPDRFAGILADVAGFLARRGDQPWLPGISPHAPYTVHPELLAQLVDLAASRRLPLAFHLAESAAELSLLQSGTGPLVDYLASRGFWIPAAIPRGTRPLDYLKRLAAAPRALVIHGNYLAEDEIDFLSATAPRMSVVYCPRTHDYFGHDPYPLAKLLRANVSVALGTDSRASNPDLSLLAEMRFIARRYPALPPTKILELGTLAGAKALGLEQTIGTLEPGKWANLAILAANEADDPYQTLLAGDQPVIATMFRGQWATMPPKPNG